MLTTNAAPPEGGREGVEQGLKPREKEDPARWGAKRHAKTAHYLRVSSRVAFHPDIIPSPPPTPLLYFDLFVFPPSTSSFLFFCFLYQNFLSSSLFLSSLWLFFLLFLFFCFVNLVFFFLFVRLFRGFTSLEKMQMKAPSFLLPFDISFLLHSTRGNKFSNNKFLEYICIYI